MMLEATKEAILREHEVEILINATNEDKILYTYEEIIVKVGGLATLGWSKSDIITSIDGISGQWSDRVTVNSRTIEACLSEFGARMEVEHKGKAVRPLELLTGVQEFWKNGYDSGFSVDVWPEFSRHLRIAKREVTVVTGVPGHGKSEFVDALLMNLARQHKFKSALFSPENYPFEMHVEKLLSKLIGKPFHAGKTERMTQKEIECGMPWISDHFSFISPDEHNITLDAILDIALKIKEESGLDVLVIDPWNTIEGNRDKGETETDYIGRCLMKIVRFARKNDLSVIIVAHPTKLQRDKEGARPVPTPYDISGSSHWFNKMDNCLCVYRQPHQVDVYIHKVKFKLRGEVGMCSFTYDTLTGLYRQKIDVSSI